MTSLDLCINLLPWRQQRRERQRRGFLWSLAGAAALAALLVAGMGWRHSSLLQRQEARNGLLQERLALLDEGIAEAERLQAAQETLLARLQALHALQGQRAQAARLLDELAHRAAPGIHFTRVALQGETLQLEGYAEANGQLSTQVRQLQASAWLTEPSVQAIVAEPRQGRRASRFTLTLRQRQPQAGEGG